MPPELPAPGFASEQVFLYDLKANVVRQLTTPWTEDFMDALRDGNARANRDPTISPDGRYVAFTNLDSDGESAILRLDLQTGSVYSLTNGTAGAVPVSDAEPSFSPDGSQIAFRTTVGTNIEIWTMSAANGHIIRHVTDDDFLNTSPSWSPDGAQIVFSSYRGHDVTKLSGTEFDMNAQIDLKHWSVVSADMRTGQLRVVTTTDHNGAFKPKFSPDGTRIAFIAMSTPGQPDIYVVAQSGGWAEPIQVTLLTTEAFFDWK